MKLKTNFNKSSELCRKYSSNSKGNVSIIFAIVIGALIIGIGVAVDMSRIVRLKSQSQNSLDSAVLAAANHYQDNGLQGMETVASEFYESNLISYTTEASITQVSFSFDAATNRVTGTADVTIPSTFMAFIGYQEFSVNTLAIVGVAEPELIDLAIMLDVSGSMVGSKLAGLKGAVTIVLDALVDKNVTGSDTSNVRVAFAPFSSSVNAGVYATNLISGFSNTNCVGDRVGAAAFTNAAPSQDFFDVDGQYAISNDENSGVYRESYFSPSGNGGNASLDELDSSTLCPDAEILPLSGDYTVLKNKLNGYQASGLTGGHLGMAWAWYLVSDEWAGFWPQDSRPEPASQKTVILMTDGQYNTYFNAANGLPNDQGEEICNNMKAADVTIYSISFDTQGDSEDLLKRCASVAGNFYDTTTIAELTAAFEDIANKLKNSSMSLLR